MKKTILSIYILLLCHAVIGQVRVTGFVQDKATHEVLIGAHIRNGDSGVATDTQGFFSITCNPKSKLIVSFVGYTSDTIKIESDTLLHIQLEADNTIDEVIVQAKPLRNEFNIVRLSTQEVNRIPSISGKPDVVKAIQVMPGIETQDEGMGTLVVRGGDPGQNMYLIDDVPILYVNHLGGFMSVFNSDIINDITVYKGGFPAKYGRKLSSVVSITQRNGNIDKRKGAFGIGVTDASFHIEGPIGNNKRLSYIISGRKTLTDGYYVLTEIPVGNDNWFVYGFHDINGKIKFQQNKKNSYQFNLYQGDDYMFSVSKTRFSDRYLKIWGNWLASAHWDHTFNKGLNVSNAFSYNYYRLKKQMNAKDGNYSSKTYEKSIVQRYRFTSDWKYSINNWWNTQFGVQTNIYRYTPNKYYNSDYPDQTMSSSESSSDHALYADNRIDVGRNISFDIGGRLQYYKNGTYEHLFLEPRVKANIKLTDNLTFAANYMETNQFSHMLLTPGEVKQDEIWLPANDNTPASQSRQYGAGVKAFFRNNDYSLELEYYQKNMTNLARYQYGYEYTIGDQYWKDRVLNNGESNSKGIELFIKKNAGKFTGFMGYTFTKSDRHFENFNNGLPYQYEYSRPHSAIFNINYQLNSNINVSALWAFKSGLPYTPVVGKRYIPTLHAYPENTGEYQKDDQFYFEELIYGDYNSKRMENNHRLDIGMQYKKRSKKGRRVEWNFNIYNTYFRNNSNMYYYNINASSDIENRDCMNKFEPLQMYKVTWFPFVPSFSYKIYFDGDQPQKKKKR